MEKKLIIAIDGYSSCGKGTLAKYLAKKLNYIFIDSGAMYRAVTFAAIQSNTPIDDVEKISNLLKNCKITFEFDKEKNYYNTFLNGINIENQIRTLEVSSLVSPISKISEVRKYLVEQQREIGKNKGIVMDGRDIGTVVFPNADLKIFMTASTEVRAKRRYEEWKKLGKNISYDEVYKNIKERDTIDSSREDSPLLMAKDAILLDNTFLSINQQEQMALNWVNEKINDYNSSSF